MVKDLHEYANRLVENNNLDAVRRRNVANQRLNPDVDRKYGRLGGEQHSGVDYRDRDETRKVQQGRAPDPGPDKLRYRPTDYQTGYGGTNTPTRQGVPGVPRPNSPTANASDYRMGAREKAYENPISKVGTKFTDIRVGSSGDNVASVQKALGITADGKFGKGTRQAVMDFQKKHGLKVDGIVGHETMSKIKRDAEVSKAKNK